jgi:hypothetical protein
MMRYTSPPRGATVERRITGHNDAGEACEVIVRNYGATRYASFFLGGAPVYRRQYSGRNLAVLERQLEELRTGLHAAQETSGQNGSTVDKPAIVIDNPFPEK